MAFHNPCSKLERAVRALLIQQGKAIEGEITTMNETQVKVLPNRVVGGTSFSPERANRPEGAVRLQIDHHFSAEVDGVGFRAAIDLMLGETADTLGMGTSDIPYFVGEAITSAGRELSTIEGNEDMANFRCDWLRADSPMHTRGKPAESGAPVWIESLHYIGFVSDASN